MICAAIAGNVWCVVELLKAGADPNITDLKGRSAAWHAEQKRTYGSQVHRQQSGEAGYDDILQILERGYEPLTDVQSRHLSHVCQELLTQRPHIDSDGEERCVGFLWDGGSARLVYEGCKCCPGAAYVGTMELLGLENHSRRKVKFQKFLSMFHEELLQALPKDSGIALHEDTICVVGLANGGWARIDLSHLYPQWGHITDRLGIAKCVREFMLDFEVCHDVTESLQPKPLSFLVRPAEHWDQYRDSHHRMGAAMLTFPQLSTDPPRKDSSEFGICLAMPLSLDGDTDHEGGQFRTVVSTFAPIAFKKIWSSFQRSLNSLGKGMPSEFDLEWKKHGLETLPSSVCVLPGGVQLKFEERVSSQFGRGAPAHVKLECNDSQAIPRILLPQFVYALAGVLGCASCPTELLVVPFLQDTLLAARRSDMVACCALGELVLRENISDVEKADVISTSPYQLEKLTDANGMSKWKRYLLYGCHVGHVASLPPTLGSGMSYPVPRSKVECRLLRNAINGGTIKVVENVEFDECSKADCSRSPSVLCRGCSRAHYCSRRCQKEDWPYHCKHCELLRKLPIVF